VDRYTNSVDGMLISRKKGIEKSITRIDDDVVNLESRVEAKRMSLIAQFTAMEKVVSRLKSTGTFLDQQAFGSNK
jgi:flagellar capping protein FliD